MSDLRFRVSYDELHAHLLKRAAWWDSMPGGQADGVSMRRDKAKGQRMLRLAAMLVKPPANLPVLLTLREFESLEMMEVEA